MRTQKKNIFKTVGMIALTLFLVSCGKDNKSGGQSWVNGYMGSSNVSASANQYINTVLSAQTQMCAGRGGNVIEQQIPVNVSGYGVAIGVTSEGSAAILDAQTRVLRLRLCQTNGIVLQQPQIISAGTITQGNCQGIFILNGLQVGAYPQYNNGGYGQGYGQPFYFAFRNPFQTATCTY